MWPMLVIMLCIYVGATEVSVEVLKKVLKRNIFA